MSLQDDVFDVADILSGKEGEDAFKRVLKYVSILEDGLESILKETVIVRPNQENLTSAIRKIKELSRELV